MSRETLPWLEERTRPAMAKRQRVFQGGKEYTVTGPTKRSRRLVFIASVKVDGRELLLFRPVKKISKRLP